MEALDLKKTHAYEIMREFQETGTIVLSTVTYLDDIACYQIEDDRHMLDTHFQSNNQLLEWLSPYIRETFQRTGVQNWNIKEISPGPTTIKKWKKKWFPKSVKRADKSIEARRKVRLDICAALSSAAVG